MIKIQCIKYTCYLVCISEWQRISLIVWQVKFGVNCYQNRYAVPTLLPSSLTSFYQWLWESLYFFLFLPSLSLSPCLPTLSFPMPSSFCSRVRRRSRRRPRRPYSSARRESKLSPSRGVEPRSPAFRWRRISPLTGGCWCWWNCYTDRYTSLLPFSLTSFYQWLWEYLYVFLFLPSLSLFPCLPTLSFLMAS